ncbi:hypothetical protein [Novosphingobium sp. Gsoil 351]|uniref:CC_3452 family protein n=1 Tax=Novosphingobium sp. Gsoil 351 TaxID=2675225 RepID=UPI0012B4A670|nr:hypothetical protein [Novosphingobium sp. Gsoil 351]QGN55243.1 hypothetical protein GKE62_12525 [Novosphingobium sp. Gsoil 351]
MTTTFSSRSSLSQLAFVAAAFVGTALSFGATASPAFAAGGSFYEVQLATPLDGAKTAVVSDVAWKCDGATCRGSQGTSRAEVVCARVARKFGEVASFASKGEALDAEGLAKCNGEKTSAVARR